MNVLRPNLEVVQLSNFQYSPISIWHHEARVCHSLGITGLAIWIERDTALLDEATGLALALYNASLCYKRHNIHRLSKHIFRHILRQLALRKLANECFLSLFGSLRIMKFGDNLAGHKQFDITRIERTFLH